MSVGMKALYRITLETDSGSDTSARLRLKSNQNRLNQNFMTVANALENMRVRIETLEEQISQQEVME